MGRAVEAAVHVAEPGLAADEQHPLDSPPVEVEEGFGDRFPLQHRECLTARPRAGGSAEPAIDWSSTYRVSGRRS